MADNDDAPGRYARWAHLRFSVVGPLLAAPPARGELQNELAKLSQKVWRHPITNRPVRFGQSTIERWYYAARGERVDPVGVLRRKVRKDYGQHPSLGDRLRRALAELYQTHKYWSYQLYADNLAVLAEQDPALGAMPSYATVVRYMKSTGMVRRRRPRGKPDRPHTPRAVETREVRSYEHEYVHGLWHLDFHVCKRRVVLRDGTFAYPKLLGILDDHSRLLCHAQWYLTEDAENLVHGLCQAFQKRALPRSILSDNGSAEVASETEQGLRDLSIIPDTTLPEHPEQNGKQEAFWTQVEERLMPMLENKRDLTLELLNEATQAWSEMEYNRSWHSEIRTTPLERYLAAKEVGRPAPPSEILRRVFTAKLARTQRQSDGTCSIAGVRFELPGRYRHLERVVVRYAHWDLGHVWLYDDRTDTFLCRIYPVDKAKNADGRRRSLEPVSDLGAAPPVSEPPDAIAPLLRKLMSEYAQRGLPPAYLPKDESHKRGAEPAPATTDDTKEETTT